MAYKKQTWVDDETVGTADRFNHMESGIEEAGKTGGVSTGAVIGWTGAEIPEGYEEIESSLLPATGGVEVGTIVYIDDDAKIPEGYVEIAIDSGWVDIPKNYASHTPLACRKIDRMVEINVRFYLSETTISVPAWGSVHLGTIPEGYRPTAVIEIPIACKDNNNAIVTTCFVVINPDGTFYIQNTTGNVVNNITMILLHTMYFTD